MKTQSDIAAIATAVGITLLVLGINWMIRIYKAKKAVGEDNV